MSFWHQTDGALVRMAAQHADDVRDALTASLNVDDIITRWNQSHPADGTTTQAARDWARLHVTPNDAKLREALRQVYAVGTALGAAISLAAYSRARLALKAPSADDQQGSLNTDWKTWTPGGNTAALLVQPPGGLRNLLDKTNATIKGMNERTLDMVGTALADGLQRGLPSADLAANLASIVDNPRRALTIAQTEMHRALSVEAVANYGEWGVTQIQWGASDTDDECADNDDEGPVEIGHVFSSGDTEPPAHPNCRCWIEPVVEGNVDMPEDVPVEDLGGDLAAVEDAAAVEDVAAQAGADALAVDVHPDLEVATTELEPVAETAVSRGPIDAATLLDKANEVDKQRAIYRSLSDDRSQRGKLFQTNFDLNAIKHVFNADGLPQVVNDVSELIGPTLYRGVALDNEVASMARDTFVNGEVSWQGFGMYGDGTYFSNVLDTAKEYAGQWRDNPQNIYQAALKPDAKVISFDGGKEFKEATQAAYAEIEQQLDSELVARGLTPDSSDWKDAKQNLLDVYFDTDPRYTLGISSTWLIKGYDAYSINFVREEGGSTIRETYTVVINRGALQVVK